MSEGKDAEKARKAREYAKKRWHSDPDYRERMLAYSRKHRQTPLGRMRHKLRCVRGNATKLGYTPCNAKAEDLLPIPENCELCGAENDRLVLDHCHTTGNFRGWICHNCNTGIGFFGENITRLESAIMYLKSHGRGKDGRQGE